MQKRKIIQPFATPYNYALLGIHKERGFEKSQTVPGMVPDLITLLGKRAVGAEVPTFRDGYSEEDYPDIHTMDKLDILQMRDENQEQMEFLKDEQHRLAKELERRTKVLQDEETLRKTSKANASPGGAPPEEQTTERSKQP